jgi:HPr kinase/phosphorylase
MRANRHATGPLVTIHATAVALAGQGVLICGRSGSGKSALALQLMALGARLVADDQTFITTVDGELVGSAPPTIRGLIEARGIGVLNAQPLARTVLKLVVDMDHTETERLPPLRHYRLAEMDLPCLHKIDAAYFPAAILQYLTAGRRDPQ